MKACGVNRKVECEGLRLNFCRVKVKMKKKIYFIFKNKKIGEFKAVNRDFIKLKFFSERFFLIQ